MMRTEYTLDGESTQHADAQVAAYEPTTLEKLAKLDADNQLSQRALRETILLVAEGFKVATGGALNLYSLPGVQDVARVEAEAVALRAEL